MRIEEGEPTVREARARPGNRIPCRSVSLPLCRLAPLSLVVLAVLSGCRGYFRTAADDSFVLPHSPARSFAGPARQSLEDVQCALLGSRLSVDLRGVPLHEVLQMLSMHAGFGLIVDGHVNDERLKRPVVLKLDNTSVYAVFYWLFRDEDLKWSVERGEIIVAPLNYIEPESWNPHVDFVQATERAWREKTEQALRLKRLSVDVNRVACHLVLETVAERAGLNLVYAPDAGKALRRRVSVHAQNAPITDILDTLTTRAGLHWRLEGEAVYVWKDR